MTETKRVNPVSSIELTHNSLDDHVCGNKRPIEEIKKRKTGFQALLDSEIAKLNSGVTLR